MSLPPSSDPPVQTGPLMNHVMERRQFMIWAVTFEGGLVLLAYLLALFADIDPLARFVWNWTGLLRGLLGTLPILALFALLYYYPVGGFHGVKRFLIEQIGPALNNCLWYDLILLALLAGVCEEILFRGLLQPWIGLGVSNVIFGLVHFITPTYAISAGLMGLYLGWLLDGTGESNLLIPVVTHAVYDYIAFLAVVRTYRRELALGLIVPPEEQDINPDDSLDEFDP